MQITEVRIKLIENAAERLLAFCSITIDAEFVVRDLKIIASPAGPFVAMPSRKLSGHCPTCKFKNPLRATYCNQCGGKLPPGNRQRDEEGRLRLYADIAHPINAACRDMIPSGFNRQTGILLCQTCKRYHHQTPRQYFDE